jgi:hypothetical protein
MGKVMTWFATHRKAAVAYAGVALTLLSLIPDAPRWVTVVIAVLTALGVHGVPNAQAEKPAPAAGGS